MLTPDAEQQNRNPKGHTMTEQDRTPDIDLEDTKGHHWREDEDQDDTQGHFRRKDEDGDEDDTEGHVRQI
jgi:hypothetical protein